MKLSPTQVVERGHHSLARRTSEVIDKIDRELQLPFASRAILLDCNATLAQIASDKSIVSVGRPGANTINRAMVLLDNLVPFGLKPDNPKGCLALASLAIRAHFGILRISELVTLSRIDEFVLNSDQSGLAMVGSSNGVKRMFFVEFNPSRAAYSTIINVHELFHSLQPEHNRA
ncbi:MAG: hypothetical protein Q7S22_08745, partial [Candidatus Micrarchaeota archaeon]|nr:hypothetical protein [Candidatus Micrarchaeota archaeon]